MRLFAANIPNLFTADYADSADRSLIFEHPGSSVVSVVNHFDSDFAPCDVLSLPDFKRLSERTPERRDAPLPSRFIPDPEPLTQGGL